MKKKSPTQVRSFKVVQCVEVAVTSDRDITDQERALIAKRVAYRATEMVAKLNHPAEFPNRPGLTISARVQP